jgi:cysteine synthase A
MSLPTLPTLDELLNPDTQPADIQDKASSCEDPLDPINLFNISWKKRDGSIPHVVLPEALTGVKAPIVVMSSAHFPSGSHKVGPAYSCLREKILRDGATTEGNTCVFPSTGNYGIGGAWVGPRIGFKSLVVLPEEMSAERFEKIRAYGADVIATPGCESNVKEIYDKVNELKQDDQYIILNQFADFGNYRFHRKVTGGSALALAAQLEKQGIGDGTIHAFVWAMGSAGTSAAADAIRAAPNQGHLKTIGLEPVQCPTLFNVGYGGHAIEGIGDKHVTWIHNVRAHDALFCIDDRECLRGLQLLQEGQHVLKKELDLDDSVLDFIKGRFGISAICNILGAIKTAKHYELGPDQAVFTAATDSYDRYPSVMRRLDQEEGEMTDAIARERIGIFRDQPTTWAQEGTMEVRRRWHNQKYFTWVEQQGMSIEALNALWEPQFWEDEYAKLPALEEQTLALRS